MRTKGGMTAVLVSYNQYIENMRFIPTWKLGNKIVKVWYAIQALVRTWWLCNFDRNIQIVHIHGAANASFDRCRMFIHLAKRGGKKVILHEHAADFVSYYEGTDRKDDIVDTLRKCDRLIVLSESWKNFFVSIGVDAQNVRVLNNIVSPPVLLPDRKLNDGKLHLMYMGEISNRKGAFDLLNAISDNLDYFKDRLVLRMGGNEVDGDVREYIKKHDDVEKAPNGMHAVVPKGEGAPAGVVFVLRNINDSVNKDNRNRIHPFYMVYISEDGEIVCDYLNPKKILDTIRLLCKGKDEPCVELCRRFNEETEDGRRMGEVSELLSDAINSIIDAKEENDIDSLFKSGGTTALMSAVSGLDDFELICFLVVK